MSADEGTGVGIDIPAAHVGLYGLGAVEGCQKVELPVSVSPEHHRLAMALGCLAVAVEAAREAGLRKASFIANLERMWETSDDVAKDEAVPS